MNWRRYGTAAVLGLALAFLLSCVVVLSEGQQALVLRFGRPIAVLTAPGFYFKFGWIDGVEIYDARLLTIEPASEQIILGDQKRIEVEPYALYRVRDALAYFQAVRTTEQARSQLAQIVSSSLRRELGRTTLPQLLSAERSGIIERVRGQVVAATARLGIDVVEVRIRRADLPSETSQAIYDRMKSEREREARELRAQGAEWAQEIKARADRERIVMISDAERDAKISRGDSDAHANEMYVDAFAQDPGFFKFFRTLQGYRQGLAAASPTLVLSPDAAFLRYFSSGPPSR